MSNPIENAATRVENGAPSGRPWALVLAVLIGAAGILAMAFLASWCGTVVFGPSSQLTSVTVTPVVLAFFFVVLLALVPLLKKILPGLAPGRREMLLILAMWLIAGAVVYENLTGPALHTAGNARNPDAMRQMTRRMKLDSHLNPALFLSEADGRDYSSGIFDGVRRVPLSKIPWRIWLRPLMFWFPLMVLLVVFSSALVRMVHRQWSRHELLTYPIATFVDSLLDRPPERALPRVMYDKVFWIGFGLTAFIFFLNGISLWFPVVIQVPLGYNETELVRQFPFLNKYCGREAYSLFRGTVSPFIVGLAVFLPAEISLTCWLGWVLMVVGPGLYFLVSGEAIGQTETASIQTGMYAALVGGILIIGRREYAAVLRCALTFRRTDDPVLRQAAAACRWFLSAGLGLVICLVVAGLDWLIAILLVASLALVLLLIARATAEIGIPWLVSFAGTARAIPLKLLGSAAIGPKGLAVMAVVGAVLDFGTTNTVAAQETTCRRLEEKCAEGLPRWGFNLAIIGAAVLAIAAGIAAALWNNYSFGSQKEAAIRWTLSSNMDRAATEINRLEAEGVASGTKLSGLARLRFIKAEQKLWRFFLVGAGIIALVSFMRLRFAWWPLHPLPFVFIDTWCMSRLYISFFVAWVLKAALLRIAGGKFFNRAKPFFLGVIAGHVGTVTLWMFVGMVYYAVTGIQPPGVPPLV